MLHEANHKTKVSQFFETRSTAANDKQ